jgi:hypothetical protein
MQSGARDRQNFGLWLRAGALALWLGLVALPAAAGTLTIEFDFMSGSSLSILGGAINTPPDGTISAGSATIILEASSITSPTQGGSAELLNANLVGFFTKDIQGQAFVSGGFSFTQTTGANGTLTPTDTITFSDALAVDIIANIFCNGTECSALGLPVSESGSFLFPLQPLPVQNLGTAGSAAIDFDVPVSLDGVQAVFHFVGVETSRSFIPEPGTAALLGLGLALLGARRRL